MKTAIAVRRVLFILGNIGSRLERIHAYSITDCMQNPRTLLRISLVTLFLGMTCVAKNNRDLGDVYLRLGDPQQEALTNSINLPVERFLPVRRSHQKNKDTSKEEKVRIMIDAGHGGKDLGAPGHFALLEKNITLKIARMVKRELERTKSMTGFPLEVMLSRDADEFVGLKDRVQMANKWNADLFVSIHANSSPIPRANGFEVYFLNANGTDEETRRIALKENTETLAPMRADVLSILSDVQTTFHIEESALFAETMFSAISRRVLSSGRGVRQGPFTVLTGTAMPAVLVEVGYVTHFNEAKNLTKDPYLKRLANAISTGIVEFAVKQKKLG